jgi:hypothetical protein
MKIYSIPVIPVLETLGEWEAGMSGDADPEIYFSLRPVQIKEENGAKSWSRAPLIQRNAFEVREAFFAIREAAQALAFFQTFGPWQVGVPMATEARPIRFSAIVRRQKFFQDALLNRKIWSVRNPTTDSETRTAFEDFYLWHNLPTEMVFRDPPVILCRCKDIMDSIRATVFLDKLDGLPSRRCAREDCGKVFKLRSKRSKIYCSEKCAHLQSVRSYNSRQVTKAKSRKGKGRA